ncbi:hypothetical protein KY285_018664 [Solanum tuberosum]|nr:hypothetical protein KY285_018664 [Solanum tuberosum]
MKSGLSRSNHSQSLFPGLERLVRKDQERSVVRSSSRSEGAKESNDIVPCPYPRKGNVISLLERIRSLCCEQEKALQMEQATGEKERLVLRNPADIELKLAAAIEREESSETFGLSSFPIQMNKPRFRSRQFSSPRLIQFFLAVKESTAEEGPTFNASFESFSLSPTFISSTSVTSHEIPSSKPEPGSGDGSGSKANSTKGQVERAPKNSFRSQIRKVFPEFEQMQCDIQAKKGRGPICAYITKEDKNPQIWGNTSKAHVMEVAEAYEGKKKTGGAPLLTVKWLSAPLQLPFAQHDHERRQNCVDRRTKRTNPLVLIERRKKENGGSFPYSLVAFSSFCPGDIVGEQCRGQGCPGTTPRSIKEKMLEPHGCSRGCKPDGTQLGFGRYGTKSCRAGRLSYRAIEAACRAIIGHFHRAMSGQFRRNGKIWVRVLADIPITGKPTKVRMGRGKGNPTGWIARVSRGQILFEMDGVSLSNARQAATLAAHKLCSSTKFVQWSIGEESLWIFFFWATTLPSRLASLSTVHFSNKEDDYRIKFALQETARPIPSVCLICVEPGLFRFQPLPRIHRFGGRRALTLPYEYSDYNSSDEQSLTFDSYMIREDDLELGQSRLLEVDNKVVLPAKSHICFIVTSVDVPHSWVVPSLGVKCDVVPGRLNQTSISVQREGVYYGQCSEICGTNHAFMPIVVEVVPRKDYGSRVWQEYCRPLRAIAKPSRIKASSPYSNSKRPTYSLSTEFESAGSDEWLLAS